MANLNDPRAMYESGEISSRSSRRNSIINKISGGAGALGETAVGTGKTLYDYTLSDNAPELVKSHKDAALLMLGGPIGSMFARSIAKETVGTLANTVNTLKQNYRENTAGGGSFDDYEQEAPEPIEEIEEIYKSNEAVVNKKTKIKTRGKKQRVEVTERVRKTGDRVLAAKTARSGPINKIGTDTKFDSLDKTRVNAIISKRNDPESSTIMGSESLSRRDLQFITYLSKSIMAKMEKSEQRTLAAKLTNNFAKNIGKAVISAIPMLRMFNATKYSTQLPNAKKVGVFNAINITLGMLYSATRSIGFETNRLIYALINVNKIGLGVNLKVKPPTDITTFTEMVGAGFRRGVRGAVRGTGRVLGALTGLGGGAPVGSGTVSASNPQGHSRLRRYATTAAKIAGYGGLGYGALSLMGMAGVPGAAPAAGFVNSGAGLLGGMLPGIASAAGTIGSYGMAAGKAGSTFLGGALGGGPLLGLMAGLGALRIGLGASRMLTQGALKNSWLGGKYQKTAFGRVHMAMSGQKKAWLGSGIPVGGAGDDSSILKQNSARDSAYQQAHMNIAQQTLQSIQTGSAQSRYFYEKALGLKENSIELDYHGYKTAKQYQEEDLKIQKSEKKEQGWFRKTMSFFTSGISLAFSIVGKGLLALAGLSAFSLATGSGGDFGTDLFENLFDIKNLGGIDLTGGLLSGMAQALKMVGKNIPGVKQIITAADALANVWNGADLTSAIGIAGGTVVGGGIGMSVGAGLGTLVAGPIGTVIGGIAGTILGSFLGAIAGEKATNWGKKIVAVQTMKIWELMKDAGLVISQSFEYIVTKGIELLETGLYKVINTLSSAVGLSFRISTGDKYEKIYEEMATRHAEEWTQRKAQKEAAYATIPIIEALADDTAFSWNKDTHSFGLRPKTEEEKESTASGGTSILSSISKWFGAEAPVEASPSAQAAANAANAINGASGVPGSIGFKPVDGFPASAETQEKIVDAASWLYKKTGITFGDPAYLKVDPPAGAATPAAGSSGTTSGALTTPSSGGTLTPSSGSNTVAIPDEYKDLVYKYAQLNNLDPNLLAALIKVESNWNPKAVSSAGAMGLMQLMPGTAGDLNVTNAFDPEQSIRGGAQYLGQMMGKYKDPRIALAAYNAGPGNVDDYGGKVPPFEETINHGNKVLALYNGSGGTGTTGTLKPSTPGASSSDPASSAGGSAGVPEGSSLSAEWWAAAKQRAAEAKTYVMKWAGGDESSSSNPSNSIGFPTPEGTGPLSNDAYKNYLKQNYTTIPELKEYIEGSPSMMSTDELIENYLNGERLQSAYTAGNLSESLGAMSAKSNQIMTSVGEGVKSLSNKVLNLGTSIVSTTNASSQSNSTNGGGIVKDFMDALPDEVRSTLLAQFD